MSWGQHCIFATHDHVVQLIADLDPADSAGGYGDRSDLYADRRQTTVGRHPAQQFSDQPHHEFDVYVSSGTDATRPGNIHLEADAVTRRGALDTGTTPPPLPAGQADLVRRAITLEVNRYFR